jgi:hypothetical protein
MASANSSGGVMGKMIDAQSIVVASTATQWFGHEGDILRYVFFHSLALAALVGILVTLQAYVPPFVAGGRQLSRCICRRCTTSALERTCASAFDDGDVGRLLTEGDQKQSSLALEPCSDGDAQSGVRRCLV